MRQIIEAGYIYIAQPPLFKIERNKRLIRYAQTEKGTRIRIIAEFGGGVKVNVQRYKGLGENERYSAMGNNDGPGKPNDVCR